MKAINVLLVLGLCASLTACGDDDDDTDTDIGPGPGADGDADGDSDSEAPGWTVLVYMVADNNLEQDGLKDLAEMQEVGSSSNVNIIVQADRAAGYSDEWNDWTTCKRLRITSSGAKEISDIGEVNMGDPKVLQSFIEWGVQTYPAGHVMLVLWDHGGAWTGFGWDDSTAGDNLTLAEIDQGVEAALDTLNRDSFDIIGFDACLMATYETAVALRGHGKYLLASEELEPGHGWDYGALNTIKNDPSADAPTLGKAILDSYLKDAKIQKTDMTVTLSLVDLSLFGGVVTAVESFAKAMQDDLATVAPVIGAQLKLSLSFGRNPQPEYALNMYDIGDLASGIAANDAGFKPHRQAIDTALEAAVVGSVNGSQTADATGLAIYFPSKKSFYKAAYDQVEGVDAWRTFLKAFYNPAFGSVAPVFTNANHEADNSFDGSGHLAIGGQLQTGTWDDVSSTTLYMGIYDETSGTPTVYFLGDQSASMDSSGYVSSTWDLTVPVLAQGAKQEYGYVSWTEKGSYLDLSIPLVYTAPGSTDEQRVIWSIIYDLNNVTVVQSTYYMMNDAGLIGELTPETGGSLWPIILVVEATTYWSTTATEPFVATDPIDLLFGELATGTQVYTELYAENYAGESDYVYLLGTLP